MRSPPAGVVITFVPCVAEPLSQRESPNSDMQQTLPWSSKPQTSVRLQDRIAEHQDHDEFTHHVHAPVVEAVAEMTTVDAAFSQDAKPRYDQLNKALDAKVGLGLLGGVCPFGAAIGSAVSICLSVTGRRSQWQPSCQLLLCGAC